MVRLATKYSKSNFLFVAGVTRLSKYPPSASRLIGCTSLTRDPPGCIGAGFFIALCADPNWYSPLEALFLIVDFFAAAQ